MCGIVGVAGTIGEKEREVMQHLLLVDYFRGPHSTGVASVNRIDQEVKVVKKVGSPIELFDSIEFNRQMKETNNVLIGHNRWATQGSINKRNAHPFDVGNIVGVHNGTLRRQYLLPDHKDFEVDSENILHSIQKIGMPETAKKLDGAWALVWWNKEEESLTFARNNERTFNFTWSDDNKTLFWASESCFLRFALDRVGIKYGTVYYTKPHHSYTFKIPKFSEEFEDFDCEVLEEYKPPFIGNRGKGTTKTTSPKTGTDKEGNKGDPLVVREPVEGSGLTLYQVKSRNKTNTYFSGFREMVLPKAELVSKIKQGCHWCTASLVVKDDEADQDIHFASATGVLCSSCAEDFEKDPSYYAGVLN